MLSISYPFRRAGVGSLSLAILLGGCATLPSSGPTAHDIRKSERAPDRQVKFDLIDITAATVAEAGRDDSALAAIPPRLVGLGADSVNDTIGRGDVLQISVFEVGVSLFGAQGESFDASARGQLLPPITVDRDGAITLPYAGRIVVASLTPLRVEKKIEQALLSLSQKPQVLVTVRENISNTVYVFGEIRRPGRFPLTLGGERLLDAVALGGGAVNSAEDTIVRLTRGRQIVEERLGRIRAGDDADITLHPGDRVELIRRPRTFLVLGASSKVSQMPFEMGDVSLAEAIARAGGPNDTVANPAAVFLFRYDPKGALGPSTPTVYRLNMLRADSYFLAQRLMMRDKDVLYFANAAANQPSKLIGVINQLFSPLVTARILLGNSL